MIILTKHHKKKLAEIYMQANSFAKDKDTFIRRYKKTERSLTIVGQDIQRYKEVQSDIQQEDPKVVIDFIETDFTPLKVGGAQCHVHKPYTGVLKH